MIAAERLDMALVTLSPRDGPAAIERLAGAGVHMLIDKPVAKSADEARRAFEAVRAADVRATIGLGKRVLLGWLDAKRMIETGRLGRILSAEAIFTTSSVAVRDPENHLFDASRSGHGILHWLGVHDVDALMWMTGEQIVEVQAMTANVLGRADPGRGRGVDRVPVSPGAGSARSTSSTPFRGRRPTAISPSAARRARSRSAPTVTSRGSGPGRARTPS